jgi:hypothetical protein
MNKVTFKEEDKIQNKKILHHEALKSLCALQYYMSTLEKQPDDLKKINYGLSFKLMNHIVNTLFQTTENVEDKEYPPELLMIFNNLENINKKLELLN